MYICLRSCINTAPHFSTSVLGVWKHDQTLVLQVFDTLLQVTIKVLYLSSSHSTQNNHTGTMLYNVITFLCKCKGLGCPFSRWSCLGRKILGPVGEPKVLFTLGEGCPALGGGVLPAAVPCPGLLAKDNGCDV